MTRFDSGSPELRNRKRHPNVPITISKMRIRRLERRICMKPTEYGREGAYIRREASQHLCDLCTSVPKTIQRGSASCLRLHSNFRAQRKCPGAGTRGCTYHCSSCISVPQSGRLSCWDMRALQKKRPVQTSHLFSLANLPLRLCSSVGNVVIPHPGTPPQPVKRERATNF